MLENRQTSKTGIVLGVVVDSTSKVPIALANFQLVSVKDTSLVYAVNTAKDGKFTVKNIPIGSYTARVSIVGYKKRKRNLLIFNEKIRVIDLDTIKLSQKITILDEIQVKEKTEPIVYDKEKLIIRVTKDMGDNGLEILENTPIVNVDIDGNVSLIGKQSTVIYIDGVPLTMAGFDKAEDLKLLSVTDIDKVEIITSPSSEYIDSKDAGIINLVTKKRFDNTYSGELFIGDNTTNNLNAGTSLRYNEKAFSIKVNYYNYNSRYNRNSSSLKTVTLNNAQSLIQQLNEYQRNSKSHLGMFNVFYSPDKYNILSAAFKYSNKNSEGEKLFVTSQSADKIDSLINLDSRAISNSDQQFLTLFVNYLRTFHENKKRISLSLSYNRNTMNSSNHRNVTYSLLSQVPSIKNDFSDNLNNNLNWKASFSNPLSEMTSYSIGYSGSFTGLTMKNDYNFYDASDGLYKEEVDKKRYYKNINSRNTITSFFNSSVIGLDYTVGLEYEFYSTNFEEILLSNSFSKIYANLLPSFSVKKRFDKAQILNFSYTHNYFYPMNKQINPHVDYSDTTNTIVGNPDLEPTYFNSYSIWYAYFSEDLQIMSSGSYSNQKNLIETITTQQNLSTSVTTYQNIASSKRYGAGIFAIIKAFEFLSFAPSAEWNKNEYFGNNINNINSFWNFNIRSSVSFKNLRLQLNFQYLSPKSTVQTESNATFATDLAVKMLFFDRQLAVSLKANDIFNTRNLNSRNFSTAFYSTNNNRETTRIFSLNISYYFQIKAKEEIEENKDMNDYDDDF